MVQVGSLRYGVTWSLSHGSISGSLRRPPRTRSVGWCRSRQRPPASPSTLRRRQPFDEGINETDRIFGADVFVQRFWQEEGLGTVLADDVRHDRILTRLTPHRNRFAQGFHTVHLSLCTSAY